MGNISDLEGFLQKASDRYFEPKSFEKDGRIYEKLGVKIFKRAYVDFINKHFNLGILRGRDDRSLEKCIKYTKKYERVHTFGLLPFYTAFTAFDLLDKDYVGAGVWTAFNLLINIYPIMLQRYNRGRLYNTLEQVKEKGELK